MPGEKQVEFEGRRAATRRRETGLDASGSGREFLLPIISQHFSYMRFRDGSGIAEYWIDTVQWWMPLRRTVATTRTKERKQAMSMIAIDRRDRGMIGVQAPAPAWSGGGRRARTPKPSIRPIRSYLGTASEQFVRENTQPVGE
jgi:hypothetical protein